MSDLKRAHNFNPGPGVDYHISYGGNDISLSKFDSSGVFLWAKTWGGISSDQGYGAAVDGSGNIYTTGSFQSTVDFDPGPDVDDHTAMVADVFLSKFDSSGAFLWAKTWGGTSVSLPNNVDADAAGNVFVTGYFYGTDDFDPGPGEDSHTANGFSQDVFLSKLDSSGGFLWAKTWGGSSSDYGYNVAVDVAGNVFVTGYFSGTVDFNPDSGVDSHVSNGGYYADAYLSKFDSSGAFLWAKTWGGDSTDSGIGVDTDTAGNTYVAGYFSTTTDFDPGTDVDNHTSNGGSDVFLSKFPPE